MSDIFISKIPMNINIAFKSAMSSGLLSLGNVMHFMAAPRFLKTMYSWAPLLMCIRFILSVKVNETGSVLKFQHDIQ